ncbi:PAAR domain-containing protein [Atlantibacter sp.]|uniref:PAAR domain-containing protein n=1 Tax=Atlantibacter sp. TaxID=1903473 RepID=UPI0028AC000A|nr:PAAR domain-containing protein [Atlantibacter sp.]
MSVGYFLRVGDSTTCGGKILTGDPTFQWYGVPAAREGDMVNCGIHLGTYKILVGVTATFDEGQALAGSLDSFSSCPCQAKFIPTVHDSYFKD